MDDSTLVAMIKKFNKNYSILSFNCRSLGKKFGEIALYVEKLKQEGCQIGIICIQECWLARGADISTFKLDGYHKPSFKGSSASTRGGLVTFIHETLKCKDLPSPHRYDLWETIFTEICDPVGNKAILINVYTPPRDNKTTLEFLTDFEISLQFLANKKCPLILCGDINIDLLKIGIKNSIAENFFDLLINYSLLPKITRPTRMEKNSATLLDNIFCSFSPDFPLYPSAIPTHRFSDHQPCLSMLPLTTTKTPPKTCYITIRKNTPEARANFAKELSDINFENFLGSLNGDNSLKYNKFYETFNNLYNKYFPQKKVKFKKHQHMKNPWMTKGLLKSLTKRDKLYSKLKKTSSSDKRHENLSAQLKNFNKVLRRLIALAKKSYYHSCFNYFLNDIKKTWQTINALLSRGKPSTTPDKLVVEGTTITDETLMAEHFNNFFASVGPNLANEIPPSNKHYTDYLSHSNSVTSPFVFKPIDPDGIVKIIDSLKSKSTSGHDGISNKVIKSVKHLISKPLSMLINESFSSSTFPDLLKLARVLPLFKKGDVTQVTNYRPISILSSFSKIFERAIHNQLTDYLMENKLLHPYQYGFRKNHSTELAGLHLVDTIVSRLDNRFKSIGIFMDLSKAFDTLDHKILIEKLSYFGLSPSACNLIENYLTNRKQYVDLNGHLSSTKSLETGVPQGSILGPLLFTLYINDIAKATSYLKPTLYADDTTLIFSPDRNVHPTNTARLINAELSAVAEWFKANKLSLNIEKTHYMIFHKCNTSPNDFDFKIQNLSISRVKTFKFLGLMINEKMQWDDHYRMVKDKVMKSVGILHRLKHLLPFSTLLTIYHSLVMSHLNFHILSWGFDLEPFHLLQKKAIRAITRSHFLSHTEPIFKQLNLPNLPTIFETAKLKFYHKYMNGILPEYFMDWKFPRTNIGHPMTTRFGENLSVNIHHTDYVEETLRFGLVKLINSLATEISTKVYSHSAKFIAKKLRTDLIARYNPGCSILHCYNCSIINRT